MTGWPSGNIRDFHARLPEVWGSNPGWEKLHISLNRTAQIYLELHFCVELHTKKALAPRVPSFPAD